MRRLIFAILALLLAAPALAQNPVQVVGPPDASSSTKYKQIVGSDGAALTKEAYPSYDNWQYETVFGDTISNAGNMVDSTEVFQTHFARNALLLVHPITAGASGGVIRVAVQIRLSAIGASDSSAHFAWTPWRLRDGTAPNDSLGHIGTTGNATLFGSREFVMVIKPDVDLATAATNNGAEQPKGFAIPLGDLWAPFMSIRFRVLNPAASTPAAYYRTRLYVTYAGGSR